MLAPLKKLAGQELIIFGLGQEGWSTYQFLREQLPQTTLKLTDEKSLAELEDFWQEAVATDAATEWLPAAELEAAADLEATAAAEDLLGPKTTIFKTPGIPASQPLMRSLLAKSCQLNSNTQLFFDLIETQEALLPDLELITIGVTGTKGKSTTASLIHHVLKENNLVSFLGGNIGQPALNCYQNWQKKLAEDQRNQIIEQTDDRIFFVLELSSHQLAELTHSPKIAVVQTIVSEHLDYYPDFASYFAAKTQLVRHQKPQDWVIYNQADKHASRLAQLSPAKKTGFDLEAEELVNLAQETPLLGRHNLYNALPAIIIGRQFGLDSTAIVAALKTFRPLPHRLQLVAEVKGVKYYDDSIATNPKATVAALQTFAEQPVILLAGGYERQQDFSQLAEAIIKQKVKALALFPPTGQRILAELKKIEPEIAQQIEIKTFTEMSAAVKFADKLAEPGTVVLLSPAAASFGLFDNYRDRGQKFKEAAQTLTAT